MDVMPAGYRVQTRGLQSSNGQKVYTWSVHRFGKLVKEGMESSESEAKKVAAKALLEHAQGAGKKSAARGLARMKLRNLLENRTYLVCGVTEILLAGGADMARVLSEAEEAERAWWEAEPRKWRKPLPTHHRALTPIQAARQLMECMEAVGLIQMDGGLVTDTKKLRTWAAKMLGDRVVKS